MIDVILIAILAVVSIVVAYSWAAEGRSGQTKGFGSHLHQSRSAAQRSLAPSTLHHAGLASKPALTLHHHGAIAALICVAAYCRCERNNEVRYPV